MLAVIDAEPAEGTQLYLDTAWHGIHFLLSAAREPSSLLGFLARAGTPVGAIDVGFGPARTIDADDVEALDEALGYITPEQLRARFDPARLREANVPPPIWDRPPAEDDACGWLLGYFVQLQALVHEAMQERQGLLLWFS